MKKSRDVAQRKKQKRVARRGVLAELCEIRPLNFLFLIIAGAINAAGVMLFLFPVGLYDSGMSGTSMLLDKITPEFLTISLFLAVLNVPIFLLGLKRQGIIFTIYSIFAVAVYAAASYVLTLLFSLGAAGVSPVVGEDILLCAIFGGVLSGVGSGMTIRFGGAIDGVDVLAVIFAKKLRISIGMFSMVFNCVLYVVCGIVMQSWSLPLYSVVTYFIGSKTIDFIVEGFDNAKCAMIVTTRAEEITDELKENFGSTGTIVDAVGGYTKKDVQIIYFIINNFQIGKVRRIVQKIDSNAFISLQDVTDIFKKQL